MKTIRELDEYCRLYNRVVCKFQLGKGQHRTFLTKVSKYSQRNGLSIPDEYRVR